MKIGVMMAAYNAAKFVRNALLSILNQRSEDIEFDIVVVNDGSTDDTASIVRGLATPEIRLVETPNQGVTKARNVAFDHMADDIDLFTSLDADDLFPRGRFARDVAYFANDPQLEVVYGYAEHFRDASSDGFEPAAGSRTLKVRSINLGCGLYRRDLVRAVGRFDESLEQAEDTDWLFRVFERMPRSKLLDDVCLYYRRHDDNMTRDLAKMRRHLAHAFLKASRRRQKSRGISIAPGIFDTEAITREPPI